MQQFRQGMLLLYDDLRAREDRVLGDILPISSSVNSLTWSAKTTECKREPPPPVDGIISRI